MIDPASLTQARHSAIDYLSRREHASLELCHKLKRKGFEESVINRVLLQLQADNLLSDERFFECYVRMRTNKGFGPLRIQQELRERGITQAVEINDDAWNTRAYQARKKRFGQAVPQDRREFSKYMRFLQSRGFTTSQIQNALSFSENDEE